MTAGARLRSDPGLGPGTLAADLPLAFEDPLKSLPQTARNLLIAAKGIIADEGFEALTLKAVSERAGENKAMVSTTSTTRPASSPPSSTRSSTTSTSIRATA